MHWTNLMVAKMPIEFITQKCQDFKMKLHEFKASMESIDCSPLLTNNEIVHFQY
jgi:hypothetical protein